MIVIVCDFYYMQFDVCFVEEDTKIVVNKEECYKVIDECMEVETPEESGDVETPEESADIEAPEESTKVEAPEESTEVEAPQDSQTEVTACPKSDSTTQPDPKPDAGKL